MKGCLNIAKIPVMFLADINLLKWTGKKKILLSFQWRILLNFEKKKRKMKNSQSVSQSHSQGLLLWFLCSFKFVFFFHWSTRLGRSEVSITPDTYTHFITSPDFHFEQIFILVMMHDGCFAASHLVFGHTSVHRVCVGKVVRDSNLVSLISWGELLSFEGRVEHCCLQILDHLVGSIWVDLLIVVPRCEVRLD